MYQELDEAATELELELAPFAIGPHHNVPTSSFAGLRLNGELELAAAELENDEAEPFYTRMQPSPYLPFHEEGHEELTRRAASGLLSGADLAALIGGVVRPDRGSAGYRTVPGAIFHSLSPATQRSHALRRAASTSQAGALSEIRQHLSWLYAMALRATNRATALGWVGEALHLIQDSYSAAHTQRALGAGPAGSSPIQRIRVFNITAWPPSRSTAPDEHNAPSDPRDSIWDSRGGLTRESWFAIQASREYLMMLLRHLATPSVMSNQAEFTSYLNRHFSF